MSKKISQEFKNLQQISEAGDLGMHPEDILHQ